MREIKALEKGVSTRSGQYQVWERNGQSISGHYAGSMHAEFGCRRARVHSGGGLEARGEARRGGGWGGGGGGAYGVDTRRRSLLFIL